ncbi:hypothetical protein [Chitinilyticum aquatile]|uniref:hypothetical protein n=1 Tax=Chitinilyticum aquatile TaxID=362520 RepID=UPI0003FA0270|nr:hypothetical protein [Chitinilyticum aquatile]
MKSFRSLLAGLALLLSIPAAQAACEDWWAGFDTACSKVSQIWSQGNNGLLLSGYAYHSRSQYTQEKLNELNEFAYGGGFDKHITHENGNEESIFFFVFADSHEDPQFNLGYMWMPYWKVAGDFQLGAGLSGGLVSRTDIFNGIPFPVILPMLSAKFSPITLYTTYIPSLGGVNNGSVLYTYGRIEF